MVLNVDLNNPPPFEDDFIQGSSMTVNTNLELGLPQIAVPNPAIDDDVVICSPRSFEEARNRSRRNQRIMNAHVEDAESQRGLSVLAAMSAATSSRERRAAYFLGKGISMAKEASQFMPPPVPTFTCPICIAAFDEEMSTKCGHIFCRKCITGAIALQGKCPTCRRKLRIKDIFRIYLPNSH